MAAWTSVAARATFRIMNRNADQHDAVPADATISKRTFRAQSDRGAAGAFRSACGTPPVRLPRMEHSSKVAPCRRMCARKARLERTARPYFRYCAVLFWERFNSLKLQGRAGPGPRPYPKAGATPFFDLRSLTPTPPPVRLDQLEGLTGLARGARAQFCGSGEQASARRFGYPGLVRKGCSVRGEPKRDGSRRPCLSPQAEAVRRDLHPHIQSIRGTLSA